ncbi:MAG TPA: organomercurial lyase [Acidimicrobiia bacterium]|nr:organomercurial lyase [Acidimicrobiia bacterium]
MPQNVPEFEFSDDAKRVRAFVFEFWCAEGRGPTLLEVHQATQLDRRGIIRAYKELQLGIDIVVNEDTQNCNLLKAPPFSSFPSQVRAYIDGKFHCFVGCASEAVAFSHMPPFLDKEVRLESHCACCFTPVTLISKNFEMQSVTPPGVLLHISLSPYDWNNIDMSRMCDSMNYVLDREHADRYEHQTATRGVVLTLDQAKMFVQNVANERMYNFHWKPGVLNPRAVIKGFQMMGVDTSPWE